MNKIKLVDVAHAAGVSKSTVSQFLNGRFNYMSEDTKARIEQAISQLNYVPNSIARSLKTDKTRIIGVIVRDIAGSYTSRAIRGMDDYCKKNGYNLIIYNTDFDAASEATALTSLTQLRVDGIIIVPSGMNSLLVAEIVEKGCPVVQFQLERDDDANNIILSDYKQGAYDATEYLIRLGHRRICFLTQEFSKVKSRKERFQGYVAALNAHGLELDSSLIQYWHRHRGFDNAPAELLAADNPPTAMFTQHLAITSQLLTELNQANICIPDDVSVLGFDELPMADLLKVPITVVKQKPYEIGNESAKLLIHQLENPGSANQRIMVPCTLVERDSCKHI
ncbi:LacI family DNA-binding transcriptional regulator [Arenicella xantha]|uniref:LacI family transcriptional regulator n=1 Tax=Arenicella xantha TaxID=644221 RepID=A0A395JKY6_9GAMM|nr:LacI family DNA-binding transcriptional regulator [Arenicella xantha]RBP49712.1 LacI family transcriptional regulator [Arenicella xantha]